MISKIKAGFSDAVESLSLGLSMESDEPQGKLQGFLYLLRSHLKRYCLAYVLLGLLFYVVSLNYRLCINKSDSLGHSVFLVQKNLQPKVGQMVAFSTNGNLDFKPGTIFVKRVIGDEGDEVSMVADSIYVSGSLAGVPQKKSSKGVPLNPIAQPGASTKVPFNHLYVKGDHERSFDSRYKELGFIDRRNVVGAVVWAF